MMSEDSNGESTFEIVDGKGTSQDEVSSLVQLANAQTVPPQLPAPGNTFLMGSPAPMMQNPPAFENNPGMSPVAMGTQPDAFVPAPPMHISPSYQYAASHGDQLDTDLHLETIPDILKSVPEIFLTLDRSRQASQTWIYRMVHNCLPKNHEGNSLEVSEPEEIHWGTYDYLDMLKQAIRDAFAPEGSEMIEGSLLAFKERLHEVIENYGSHIEH
ncbi:unnamed protein product [Darwinula stevensoni]|uniref:Uncharacterized protein n=1 Tax=Darwinula stevensoni TaxID=69355 RepID=A0A7R8XC26_9CRUS|nr:unnamed protein product [Darwinula stevensoni]CAG0892931.1 unnamed protein product [Darwinula stevensoni]